MAMMGEANMPEKPSTAAMIPMLRKIGAAAGAANLPSEFKTPMAQATRDTSTR